MCPKILDLPKKDIAFNPCGTGPYTLEKYNPAEYLIVKKNPNYWQAGLPKLDRINFRPVLEDATRVAMLRTGEAQYCDVHRRRGRALDRSAPDLPQQHEEALQRRPREKGPQLRPQQGSARQGPLQGLCGACHGRRAPGHRLRHAVRRLALRRQ